MTLNECIVLESVKAAGEISPRQLEQFPPQPLSHREVRVAIQALVLRGELSINDSLRLETSSKETR